MGKLVMSPSYNYLPERIRMMIPDFPDILYFKSLAGHGDAFLLKTLPLLGALERKKADRLNSWFAFFTRYDDFGFAFFNPLTHALVNCGSSDQLLLELTDDQTLDAMAFVESILKARPYMRFKSNEEAVLFMQIAAYYAAYRPLVRRPLMMCISSLGEQITLAALKEFFLKLFVQWEYPKWLLGALPYLKAIEIDIVMMALQGSNIRNHPALPCPISSKEAHLIIHEIAPLGPFKDEVILRAIIHAKFLQAFPSKQERDLTHEYFRLCRTFENSAQEFFRNIQNWLRGLKLFLSPNWPDARVPMSSLLDFLEFAFRAYPAYNLRGRTAHSLSREVIEWHDRFHKTYNDENASWKGANIPDKEVVFREQRFAFKQLLSGSELAEESRAMRHCVHSYSFSCQRGQCSIWSHRMITDAGFKRMLTIELRGRKIFQVKGFGNRDPKADERKLIQMWVKLVGVMW